MAKAKSRDGKEGVTTWLDVETYWKFKFMCERKYGKKNSISQGLRDLVCAAVKDDETETVIAEAAREEMQYTALATERQKAFIYALVKKCDAYGVKHENVDTENLTNRGADKTIRSLKSLLENSEYGEA